jgi:hypothetical protein
MPGPPRTSVEADREGLLQPVCRPDIERQPLFHKSKPPKLKGKALPCLAEYPAEDLYRLPLPEQQFTVINRRPNFVPGVLNQ